MADSIKKSRVSRIGTGTASAEATWTVCNLTENIDNFDLLIIGFAQGSNQARFNYPTIVTTVSDFKKTSSTYFDIITGGHAVYYVNNSQVSFQTGNTQIYLHVVGVKL